MMNKNCKVLDKLKVAKNDYYKRWENILDSYEKDINTGTFISETGFTPHDITHCENIMRILSDILPDSFYDKYGNENLFALAVAVLLHDLSMARSTNGESRKNHGNRSKDEILEEVYSDQNTVLKQNISDRETADAIVDIIYAHSDDKSGEKKIFTFQEIVKDANTNGFKKGELEDINVPLLAAFLRLSDELDIDYNRIRYSGYKYKENIESSKMHYLNCELFKKVRVAYERDTVLELSVNKRVFDNLDEDKKVIAAGQIIEVYKKIKHEFDIIYNEVLNVHKFTLDDWKINKIELKDYNEFEVILKKKGEY